MLELYVLELIQKPGFFVCNPLSMGAATVLTFDTPTEAEAFRWSQDALLVMGTKVSRTNMVSM